MDKDLPNIYKGVINNSNNQDSSILKEEIKKQEVKSNNDVEKDIKRILTSKEFIYHADVLITLKDNCKIKKTIIGSNNNSLITIDDELIDINSIQEIELI